MDEQNKNLILATVLSALVILVWLTFFPPQEPVAPVPEATPTAQNDPATTGDPIAATPEPGGDTVSAPSLDDAEIQSRELALAATPRVRIDTPRLAGSVSLKGGRIDDLSLKDYRVTLDEDSDLVTLLSPVGGAHAYYALYGWAPVGDLEFSDVPGANTDWSVVSNGELTPQNPLELEWDNGSGLIFNRKISVDDNYLFTIEQSVRNNGDLVLKVSPYGIIARHGEPDTIGFYILHEGVVRAFNDQIEEIDYNDMPDQPLSQAEAANIDTKQVETGGWIGFTDKYWMTTLIPDFDQKFDSVAKYSARSDVYQTDMRLPIITIEPGGTGAVTTSLFAGAKEWKTIQHYQDARNIDRFVDSIDWGWFFFLTKPIFRVLHFMNGLIGNMGVAIISLTIMIKALLFPLAYKSYVSMAKMKELQPEMEKLKEAAGDDRQKLQQGMMKLYKEKKVSPLSGCLPILLQIPIFFSLYKVIFVTIELRHAPFFGWIHDLSSPDPTSVLNLFGLLPWDRPDPGTFAAILSIGVWPILMGISMWMQQKLNPAPADKTQAQIFAWMPWVFMFMLGRFASGLVIYWVANNTITFLQQYTIMRTQGVKPDIFGNIRASMRRKGEKTG